MNESFTVERTDIKSLLSNYNLSIPAFQRKFVWNDDKKRDLIDSLNMSFPIGAITLFLNREKNSYLIVDGLQRINTIKAYLNNPCNIVPFKNYYERIKSDLELFSVELKLKESKIKKSVKLWYESLNTVEECSSFKFKDFSHLQTCLEDCGLATISRDLGAFQKFRSILLKPIDIEDENIGLITYKGDLDNLPELFSKINQKNVSLTGYEILHSLWYDYIIPKDYPGFDKFFNAFKRIANRSEGYIDLDDNFFDNFNMYMNISSLEEIIEDEINDDAVKNFFSLKCNFHVFKSETVFDIFSTIYSGTTNRINKSVVDIFKDLNNVPYNFILGLNNAIVDVANFLNNFLYDKNINAYSKYFYIYFFYYVFIKKYKCDIDNKICEKNCDISIDEEQMYKDIQSAIENRWFKDENRQLSFFVNKIIKLKLDSNSIQ